MGIFSLPSFSTFKYISTILIYYTFGIAYPLFRSSRIARGRECEENKEIILKFWIVHCFLHIINYYLGCYLTYFDISDIAISALYFALVFNNF